MLRVGLTGELGSGKSTVARLLAERGAVVLSSDEMGRAMMQPGNAVHQAIVERFGPGVLLPDGQLNRPELARLAFDPLHPRVEELNAIVHPAVLAEQERVIADLPRTRPEAIVVVESALIFTTKHAMGDEPWRKRFDRLVVVSAPDELKVNRYLQRVAGSTAPSAAERTRMEADARARLAAQRIPGELPANAIVIENTGDLDSLARRADELIEELRRDMASGRK